MPVFIAGAGDMRRDQHPRVGPKPLHRRMLELADVYVESGAAQVIMLQSVGQGVFVDDLSTRDVDQDAARFHRGEAVFVEKAGCVRRPLAADRDDVAAWQERVEIGGAAEFTESRGQGLVRSCMTAGADYMHSQ